MMRTGRMLLSRGFSTSKDDGGRLRLAVKVVGGVLFMSFNVGMIWYWLSQEEEGRKRAEQHFAKHGPRKKTQLMPDELQPEYIQQQRYKFQQIVREKAREEGAATPK